jgi:hypothetical protein
LSAMAHAVGVYYNYTQTEECYNIGNSVNNETEADEYVYIGTHASILLTCNLESTGAIGITSTAPSYSCHRQLTVSPMRIHTSLHVNFDPPHIGVTDMFWEQSWDLEATIQQCQVPAI